MGFMDNVSTFTKGVGAKAKGNYDVVNLNSQISTLQRDINSLYTLLGEKYYSVHSTDPDEAVAGLVEQINAKKAKIDELQNDILKTKDDIAAVQLVAPQMKEFKFCVKCGNKLAPDAVFCTKCGTKQPENQVSESPVVVAEIDNPVIEEVAASVAENTIEEAVVEEVAAVPQEEYVEPQVDTADEVVEEAPAKCFCGKCGSEIEVGSLFCPECGAKQE